MSEAPTYVLERTFDAPRALVWRAWTDPALVARWYGPHVQTVVHTLDVRPGGVWLNEMRWGGRSSFERMDFTEVSPPERLAWRHATTDADWLIIANPMMADWPRVLLTTVTFDDAGDRTALRLTWTPHEATEAEKACFAAAMAGLDRGWGSGMDILAEILSELQARRGA
ncbi:MAG: SRPBCC family protein [Inquilinaceae bacterium]